MDKLDEIFTLQSELDKIIRQKRKAEGKPEFTKEEWIQKKCFALIEEAAETAGEVNYKWWKVQKPVDDDKLFEELIDVFHFWVSMCIDAGLTPDKAIEIYRRKNAENRLRQEGKSQKPGY